MHGCRGNGVRVGVEAVAKLLSQAGTVQGSGGHRGRREVRAAEPTPQDWQSRDDSGSKNKCMRAERTWGGPVAPDGRGVAVESFLHVLIKRSRWDRLPAECCCVAF